LLFVTTGVDPSEVVTVITRVPPYGTVVAGEGEIEIVGVAAGSTGE
jgi:hypothetical protein